MEKIYRKSCSYYPYKVPDTFLLFQIFPSCRYIIFNLFFDPVVSLFFKLQCEFFSGCLHNPSIVKNMNYIRYNKLKRPDNSFIVITHYQRLLDFIVPDVVHVLYDGRIVKTAGKELALELEEKGYDWIKKEIENNVTT